MAQTLFDGFTGLVRDQAGNIVTGAQVEVLNAVDPDPFSASNTLATVFSDRAGTSQVDQILNPILSDAQGKFTFYADAGYYHVIAYNAGENYAIPDVAIGTAKSLDIEDAGGGAMPNEVRMFVGSVPAGWEKIQTQPLNLSEALYTYLEQDQFGVGQAVNEPGRSLGYVPGVGLLGMSGSGQQSSANYQVYVKQNAGIDGLGSDPSAVLSSGRLNQARPVCDISGDGQSIYMFGSSVSVSGADAYATRVSLQNGAITVLASAPISIPTGYTTDQVARGCARESGTERYYMQASNLVMLRYNAGSNTWDMLSNRPDGAMGSFVLPLPDGRILLAGGSISGVGATSDCYVYDPIGDSWSAAAPLPSSNLPFAASGANLEYNHHQVIPVKLASGDIAFGYGAGSPSFDAGIFVYNVGIDDWSFFQMESAGNPSYIVPNNVYSSDGLTLNSYHLRGSALNPTLLSQHRLAADPAGLTQNLVYYARYVGE